MRDKHLCGECMSKMTTEEDYRKVLSHNDDEIVKITNKIGLNSGVSDEEEARLMFCYMFASKIHTEAVKKFPGFTHYITKEV